jgi:hypothetical protein
VARDLVPLSHASPLFPTAPHPTTLWRWAREGVGGVKLETIRVGGRRFVTRTAVDEFLRATNISASNATSAEAAHA